MAYGDLILAQKDDIDFGLVDESCTEALPKVDALFDWSKLKSKYEGMMVMTMLSLKREYNTSQIEDKGKDPDIWISSLKKLKTRLNKDFELRISDQDVMTKVLNNLPEAYDGMVDLLEKELEKGELELTTLCEKLIAKYKKL